APSARRTVRLPGGAEPCHENRVPRTKPTGIASWACRSWAYRDPLYSTSALRRRRIGDLPHYTVVMTGACEVSVNLRSGALFLFEFFALLFQDGLAAELDLVALQAQHLHQDLVAFLQLITPLLDAVFRDLGNMQQAVGAGEDLDKRAEIDDPDHFAQIRFAHLGHRADIGDHLDAAVRGGAVGGENLHAAVVFDVDLATGRLHDAADDLATRPDQLANLVGWNLHGEDARGVGRHSVAWSVDHGVHLVEDDQPGPPRLLQRLLQ